MNNDILRMKLDMMSHELDVLEKQLKFDGLTENKRLILCIENANSSLSVALYELNKVTS